MRQWRDAARSGEGPAVGQPGPTRQGRGSGASWGPASGPGVSGGPRQRGSGASWGPEPRDGWDDGYHDPPAARSGNRNRRPPNDYEEVDLERALVPTRGDLMPMTAGAGVPALPGMPGSDDEERALGIRRPAYIPATGDGRRRKLGTWRVVSGVLSVMLVCIASCGLAGLFGHNVLSTLGIGPSLLKRTASAAHTCVSTTTPAATPGPSQKYITGAVTAKFISTKGDAVEPTSTFPVGEYVYVLAMVRNLPNNQSHVISVRWYLDGVYIGDIQGASTSQTVSGNYNVDFALTYGNAGCGMAKIYLDRPASDTTDTPTDPTLAQTVLFNVIQPAGTVTPGTVTPHASIAAPPVAWRGALPSV